MTDSDAFRIMSRDMAARLLLAVCIFALALLHGCGGKHGLREQNFQTPMLDVRDVRALFAGDSITANWSQATANRNTGMPGNGSSIIGQRFAAEIAAGTPRYVHILAGTNDDLRTPQMTLDNIGSMIDMARARTIPVIVGTLPPLDLRLFPELAPRIAPFNQMLIPYAKGKGAFVADYYSAMILPTGLQNGALFMDGIHPNDAGYAVMDSVLRKTRREMWRTIATPEQRAAWKATRAEKWKNATPEQKQAWKDKKGNK